MFDFSSRALYSFMRLHSAPTEWDTRAGASAGVLPPLGDARSKRGEVRQISLKSNSSPNAAIKTFITQWALGQHWRLAGRQTSIDRALTLADQDDVATGDEWPMNEAVNQCDNKSYHYQYAPVFILPFDPIIRTRFCYSKHHMHTHAHTGHYYKWSYHWPWARVIANMVRYAISEFRVMLIFLSSFLSGFSFW